jgi:hypothetical protein
METTCGARGGLRGKERDEGWSGGKRQNVLHINTLTSWELIKIYIYINFRNFSSPNEIG